MWTYIYENGLLLFFTKKKEGEELTLGRTRISTKAAIGFLDLISPSGVPAARAKEKQAEK